MKTKSNNGELLYRIFDSESKLFVPQIAWKKEDFDKKGHFWFNLKRVISNLLAKQRGEYKYIPDSWEVIEYKLVEIRRIKPRDVSKKILNESDYKIKKMIK